MRHVTASQVIRLLLLLQARTRCTPALNAPGVGRWRPARHAQGAVPVLNPSAALAPGRYLLRAERVRPVVQNEPDLRVGLAFRPQGRARPRLVLHLSHFGVQGLRQPGPWACCPGRSLQRPLVSQGSLLREGRALRMKWRLGNVVSP